MTRISNKLKNTNETLLDLVIGSLLYGLVFLLIGLIFVENKLSFSLGVILGTGVSVFAACSMYHSLNVCLDMTSRQASVSMTLRSIGRLMVMLVAAWLSIKSSYVSFPGTIVGMFGLKMAAHLHMYTNVYITKKIIKKGG